VLHVSEVFKGLGTNAAIERMRETLYVLLLKTQQMCWADPAGYEKREKNFLCSPVMDRTSKRLPFLNGTTVQISIHF
jgi:hypothetical protein